MRRIFTDTQMITIAIMAMVLVMFVLATLLILGSYGLVRL